MSPDSLFAANKFAVARSMVTQPLLGFLWNYMLGVPASRAKNNDLQVPGSIALYADVVMEHVLERLRPEVERLSGLALFPTYSYCRMYKPGDDLKLHEDRPACEISVTLNVGQEPPRPWPIWLQAEGEAIPVSLEPGDALIYRGMDVPHWREPYPGERLAQVFLHYVDQAGPHAEWRFDKRDGLNMPIALPI